MAKKHLVMAAVVAALAGVGIGIGSKALQAADEKAAGKPVLCMARYAGPANDPKANPPQRWDDILWENDRTAHRIYGPAVSEPPPKGEGLVTSGIDVWVKSVRTPFMDKQLASGKQHDNHGEGQDCYDVQQTCGGGGLGIWNEAERKLYRSANWAEKGGFVNGPDVAAFWVDYAPWDASGGRKVKEHRSFTLPAGTNFTRMVSTIDDAGGEGAGKELQVAIGIARRKVDGDRFKGKDYTVTDKDTGVMVYWEPDQTYRNQNCGNTGVAVVVDPKSIVKFVTDDPAQNLVIVRVTPGKPWAYYMGACWSKGLDFHTKEEWEKYVREFKPNFDAGAK